MSDLDPFDALRASLTDVQMTVPLSSILAAGRHRRRVRSLCYLGGVAAMAGLAAFVGLGTSTSPTRPDGTQLTAFTVATQADGATTLTLLKGDKYRLDPDALRQALAVHHIAAVVRLNTTCDSIPSPPSGLDQVITAQRTTESDVTLTIDPSALAADEELSIGYYPSHTTWGLIYQGKPLDCHT
jgi:sugar/nucleoside kinase (ribokinase family)